MTIDFFSSTNTVSQISFDQSDVMSTAVTAPNAVTELTATVDLNALLSAASLKCPMMADGTAPSLTDPAAAENAFSETAQGTALALFLTNLFAPNYADNLSGGDAGAATSITAQAHVGFDKLIIAVGSSPITEVDNTAINTELNLGRWKDYLFTSSQLTEVLTEAAIQNKSTQPDPASSDFEYNFDNGDSIGSLVEVTMAAGAAVSKDYWRLRLVHSSA